MLSFQVRFQAVRAVAAFILLHEKEVDIQKQFVDLLPLLIQVIQTITYCAVNLSKTHKVPIVAALFIIKLVYICSLY